MLEDIATLTGGQVVSEELGIKLESIGLKDLQGSPKRVVIDKDNTTIVNRAGNEDIEGRVKQIGTGSKKPPLTMTVKSSRKGSRNWLAALPLLMWRATNQK